VLLLDNWLVFACIKDDDSDVVFLTPKIQFVSSLKKETKRSPSSNNMIAGMMNRSHGGSYTDIPTAEIAYVDNNVSSSSSSSTGNRNTRNSHNSRRDHNNKNECGATIGNFFLIWSWPKIISIGMVLLLTTIVVVQQIDKQDEDAELQRVQDDLQDSNYNYHHQVAPNDDEDSSSSSSSFSPKTNQNDFIPMPAGVNFGSWLSLEDYFFAGKSAVEVATPGFGEYRVAACLPPMHVGQHTGPKWYSETDLLVNMWAKSGSMAHAIEVFQAHRNNFIDFDVDLKRLASLGIKNVRVPMSWCITNHDPRKVNLKNMTEAQVTKKFTCQDPFFGKDVLWPAIPKALVEEFLRACHKHGVQAALDIHTYPGGTSIGTFSGVWPRWPKFWTDGDTQSADIGHNIFSQFVNWMETLSESDPDAFAGLRGLSPMNEPAHLAGLFGGFFPNTDQNFLPPLPIEVAQAYVANLTVSAYHSTASRAVPDGTHLRVFHWFHGAVDIFRNSQLPNLGKEIHANIHESILSSDFLQGENEMQTGADAMAIIASWWCSTTTPEERSSWSILDVHHYNAWSSKCSGTVDGQDAGYACGDEETRAKVLQNCTLATAILRQVVDQQCGEGAKLMSAEFSAASHHSVRRSCTSVSNLRDSYTRQVNVAKEANVELFYWSYHMPYGGAFRPAWSFQQLMYLLGVLDKPDEPEFECNDHLADAEEPNDDVWQ
jgi:hypothetical protein